MVMYLGQVVELGPVDQVFDAPRHPYTQALLRSMPSMEPGVRTESAPLSGDPPNPIDPPSGCRFHTRCAQARAACASEAPSMTQRDGHAVRCLIHQSDSGYAASGALS
ncbi:putative D,D-dipeptide transport ATP-binding protein DdpF [compost metagenome]